MSCFRRHPPWTPPAAASSHRPQPAPPAACQPPLEAPAALCRRPECVGSVGRSRNHHRDPGVRRCRRGRLVPLSPPAATATAAVSRRPRRSPPTVRRPPRPTPATIERRRPPQEPSAAAFVLYGPNAGRLHSRASPPPTDASSATASTAGIVPDRPRPAPAAASPPATVGKHQTARELAAPYAVAAPPAALRRLTWSASEPHHLLHPSPAGPPAGIPPAANPSSPLT
ncbi:proline-rich protein 36-like, partial [Ananas comosus]|uniref:Proline-rich protein 36-like n=1 Tax=Ananas comosus TaxID=4615 RepID=A0A6P5EFV5_ANACO